MSQIHLDTHLIYYETIKIFYMWMSMANLPSSQAEIQKRIVDLVARVKTRGQRPEPDIPELDSVPSPIATQSVFPQYSLPLLETFQISRIYLSRIFLRLM